MFLNIDELLDIEKILKNEYGYEYNGDLKDLLDREFIELEGDGVNAMFWFYYKGSKYLFKPLDEPNYNVWGEILSCKLADYLHLPHAEYRIATFGDKTGVITKSFLKDNDKLIIGSEFFQDFLNRFKKIEKIENVLDSNLFRSLYNIPEIFLTLNPYDRKRMLFNYLNNVESVSSILNSMQLDETSNNKIVNSLKDMLIFDIITLQYDRHPNNWGLINNDGYDLAILYDNSTSFGLNYLDMRTRINNVRKELINTKLNSSFFGPNINETLKNTIYDQFPVFTVSTKDNIDPIKKVKVNNLEVLKHYYETEDDESIKRANDLILSVDSDVIEKLIKEAEEENHIKMDENLFLYILDLFDYHLSNIHGIVNDYGRVKNGRNKK